jgi:hypothetical protein
MSDSTGFCDDHTLRREIRDHADDAHDWSECEICKEGIDGGGNTERYQSALKDADSWDDFSLDDGGESA